MAVIDITPQNSPKKPISGAFYGTSGYGVYTSDADPHFNGGMFVNGGFEDGINGWLEYQNWSVVDSMAENPATTNNQILYQNFTLVEAATYRISAVYVEGDATINYLINDGDSGVGITTGDHEFTGVAGAVSIGVIIVSIGTVKSVVDNLRLVRIS